MQSSFHDALAAFLFLLTLTSVSSLPLGSGHVPSSGSGVDDGGLSDDVTILEQSSDTSSGVGVGDLGGLLGVEPD